MDLRREGRLKEAYELGKKNFNQDPLNLWNKIELGWVLYDLMKSIEPEKNGRDFIKYLNEYISLQIPAEQEPLNRSIAILSYKFIKGLLGLKHLKMELIKSVLKGLNRVLYPKPSETHSYILRIILEVNKREKLPYDIMKDWLDLRYFREEDFKQRKVKIEDKNSGDEKEMTVISLVESFLLAVKDSFKVYISEKGKSELESEFKNLDEILRKILKTHDDMMWIRYAITDLYLCYYEKLNDKVKSELLKIFLPFARAKKRDYWVWVILSELSPTEEMAIGCLCKAILCSTSEKYLVKVRVKLAKYFIKMKMYSEARHEIDKVIEVRRKEGWKIPESVLSFTQEKWYISTKPALNNLKVYDKFALFSNAVFYFDVEPSLCVVSGVNKNSGIVYCVIPTKEKGKTSFDQISFDIKRFTTADIQAGDFLKIKYRKERDGRVNVGVVEKVSPDEVENVKQKLSEIYKEIEGDLRVKKDRKGELVGFVEGVLVPTGLLFEFMNAFSIDLIESKEQGELTPVCKNGSKVKIKVCAVASYDKTKGKQGWKAVKLIAKDIPPRVLRESSNNRELSF
jgi:hypothetical protein